MDTKGEGSKRCRGEFDLMHAHAPRTAYFQSLPRLAGLLDWSEASRQLALQPVPQEPDGFQEGSLVEIHSLTAAPEHNGKIARLINYTARTREWTVKALVKNQSMLAKLMNQSPDEPQEPNFCIFSVLVENMTCRKGMRLALDSCGETTWFKAEARPTDMEIEAIKPGDTVKVTYCPAIALFHSQMVDIGGNSTSGVYPTQVPGRETFWCEVLARGPEPRSRRAQQLWAVELTTEFDRLTKPLLKRALSELESQSKFIQQTRFIIESSNIAECKKATKREMGQQPRVPALFDAAARAHAHSSTWETSSPEELHAIKTGDAVKVAIPGERFWCEVKGREGDVMSVRPCSTIFRDGTVQQLKEVGLSNDDCHFLCVCEAKKD